MTVYAMKGNVVEKLISNIDYKINGNILTILNNKYMSKCVNNKVENL